MFAKMDYDINLVKKALVTLAIEETLLDIGKLAYDKVAFTLYQKYNSYFQDCYEHPEYLNEILHQLYGNGHEAIVNSIKKQLEEFSYNTPIEKFLKVLSK